ncbi:MAG: hypothetical protein MI974_33640 [Chitinophagales bacterium]|nr:hypothetical protein [Chitinophagales bacterium]
MKKNKLFTLLSSFSTVELQRFGEFLNSPYFNKNRDIIKLYSFLSTKAPEFDFTKKSIYDEIYPGRSLSDRKLGYLMSDLLQIAESFLAIEKFQRNPSQKHLFSLDAYADRGLDKHYNYLHKKILSSLDKEKLQSKILLAKHQLYEVETLYFSRKKVRKFDPSVQKAYEALNTYYYLQLLKQVCYMIISSGIVKSDFSIDDTSIKLIDSLLEKETNSPLLKIYLLIYQTITIGNEKDDAYFKRLMHEVGLYQDKIDNDEMREVYLFAINFCGRKIRGGAIAYIQLMLKIYEDGIGSRALMEKGYLSHWTYTNVVRLGLKEKSIHWAEQFIDKYKPYLHPNYSHEVYHLNLAELQFKQRRYNEALKSLTHLQFTDPFYHLASRAILIKSFYELGEVEPMTSALASFTIYLKRNKKVSTAHKKIYLNFCTTLYQLLTNNSRKRYQVLDKIKSTQALAERAWLLKVWEEQKL